MNVLQTAATPQLKTIHRGKVRDSLRVDAATRLLVVSDRKGLFGAARQSRASGKVVSVASVPYTPESMAALSRHCTIWYTASAPVMKRSSTLSG